MLQTMGSGKDRAGNDEVAVYRYQKYQRLQAVSTAFDAEVKPKAMKPKYSRICCL